MQFLKRLFFTPVDVSTTGSWSRQCGEKSLEVHVLVTGIDKSQQFRQTVQKTVDFPQEQFLNKVLDMLVMVQRLVSGSTVQKTLEFPQFLLIDKGVGWSRQRGELSGVRSFNEERKENEATPTCT